LRAFAISLGGNVNRADDLEQETNAPPINLAVCRCSRIARAIAKISATRPRSRCIGVHFSPIPDPFPRIAWQNTICLPPSRTYQVAETTINMVDALRGQQAQLRRLLAQKVLIGDAPKTTLSEMQALVIELHRLLAELERAIQDQLQQGRK
jgi:hypothetical protein